MTMPWLQYPGWHNGLVFEWLRSETSASFDLLPFLTTTPERLPSPDVVVTPTDMHERTDRATNSFAIVSGDASGASLENFVSTQEYRSGLGFNHMPENACTDKGEPTGPLHPRTYLMLFYRPDALAALHAAGLIASKEPPDEWLTLVEMLRVHAGAVEADGVDSWLPRHGLCVTTSPDCGRLGDVLAAIAASVVQTHGPQQGYVFDLTVPPPSVMPLITTAGWRYAAELLHKLLVFNAPDSRAGQNETCWGVSPVFLAGNCLFTLDWDAALPLVAAAKARGSLGAAPLPGSAIVVDRVLPGDVTGGGGEGRLVPCNQRLCALTANHDLLYLRSSTAISGAAAAPVPKGNETALQAFAAHEAAVVASMGLAAAPHPRINRAPYSVAYGATFSVSYSDVDRDAMPSIAMMQLQMVTNMDSYRELRQSYTDSLRLPMGYTVRSAGDEQNCTGYKTVRWWEALAPDGHPPDVRPLATAAGLVDHGASAEYLRTLWHAIHNPNAAPDVASPVPVNWFKYAMSYSALHLLPAETGSSASTGISRAPGGVDGAIELLTRLFEDAIEAFGEMSIREAYVASISAPPWRPPDDDRATGQSSSQVAAIVGSLAAGLFIVAMVAVLLALHRRRRQRHRDLLGRVLAPRVGADTTLLITDVQNSTVLWEQVPVADMDLTIKLHHSTIRRLLAAHDGYESATEGDSFIVAFASPTSAVAFAVATQVELMVQDWPQKLLQHPDAAPVVVVADAKGNNPAELGLPIGRNHSNRRVSLQGNAAPCPRTSFSSMQPAGAVTIAEAGGGGGGGGVGPRSRRRSSGTNPFGIEMGKSPGFDLPHMRGGGCSPRRESMEDLPVIGGKSWKHASALAGTEVTWQQHGCSCTWLETLAAAYPLWGAPEPAALIDTGSPEKAFKRNGVSFRLPDGRQGVLAYRGLRVRMGMHTGLDDPQHISFNKVGSAFKYTGLFAEITKLVSDAAPGGMVTLSSSAFARLRNSIQQRDRSGSKGADAAVVVYAGHHVLSDKGPRMPTHRSLASQVAIMTDTTGALDASFAASVPSAPSALSARTATPRTFFGSIGSRRRLAGKSGATLAVDHSCSSPFVVARPHSVFLAVHTSQVCRLALSPPLRTLQLGQLGTLSAPIGRISVAFMKVVGASTLLAELPGAASRALDQFQSLVCRMLGGAGGYLVEGGDGLVLAAFGCPAAAVEWALDSLQGLKELEWEDELLEHELCGEELAARPTFGDHSSAHFESPDRKMTALSCGLRVKVGLAVGHAAHTLTEASGRLSYRGKVMNRAARIAGIAAAGQVLCTGEVWEECERREGFCDRVVGCCLGKMNLKGIAQQVDVVHCMRD